MTPASVRHNYNNLATVVRIPAVYAMNREDAAAKRVNHGRQDAEGRGEGRGRRRRGRGGRDRFEGREHRNTATVQEQPEQSAELRDEVPYIQNKAPAFPAVEADATLMADTAAAETELSAAVRSDAPQAALADEGHPFAPVPAAYAEPPAERVLEHVQEATPAPKIPAAPVTLEPILLPPDLKLIETDPDKLRIAASKVEPPQPPRPPRMRPPLPPVSNEPLVQIETSVMQPDR